MKNLRYLGIVLGFLFVFGCNMPPYGTIDAPGLEGYWQFDGNSQDSSVQDRRLTLEGGPTYGTGLFGNALIFDGDGGKSAYDSGSDTAFDLGDDAFTIQVWVSFTDLSLEQVLIEKWTQDPTVAGYTLTKLSGNDLRFAYATAAGEQGVDTLPLSLATGTWHHFVVRREGSTIELFLDGVSVQSATISAPVVPSANPLRIGRRTEAAHPLKGSVDEVAFWSKALTGTEITAYYNGGSGTQITSP